MILVQRENLRIANSQKDIIMKTISMIKINTDLLHQNPAHTILNQKNPNIKATFSMIGTIQI